MKEEVYYTEKDLVLGSTIQVFGRQVMIYDCDVFTRTWYKEK